MDDGHMNQTVKTGMRALAMVGMAIASLSAQQAPQTATPKQVPGYIIGPGDVLRVSVYVGGTLQQDFRFSDYTVQTDGAVVLPLLSKPVIVAGLSVSAAAAAIRQALIDGKQFDDATVDITMMGYHSSQIRVQGAVRTPGSQTMTAEKMNISDALNAAGGLQPSAGTQIRVKRAKARPVEPDVLVVDGWEVYSKDDLNDGKLIDVQLYDDDTVDVPVAPKFFVNGFVTQPGEYQWEPNLTLERALLRAGDVRPEGAKNRVSIRRMDPKTKESKEVKLAKDKLSTIIEPGDVIYVPKRRM